jgi:hypothetical protein
MVDLGVERLVGIFETSGIPKQTIARGMICAAAGLMISEIGHEATSKEMLGFAEAISHLAVKGNA